MFPFNLLHNIEQSLIPTQVITSQDDIKLGFIITVIYSIVAKVAEKKVNGSIKDATGVKGVFFFSL